MIQRIKMIMIALCILTLNAGFLGSVKIANASDHWKTRTYSSQKININKSYERPRISRAINLDDFPQIQSTTEGFDASPQEAITIEPAAGTMSVQEEIQPVGLESLEILPEVYPEEEATIETITEDILAVETDVSEAEIMLEEPKENITEILKNNPTPAAYSLGPDDKIKITVYGEKDMSGEFKITSDGSISVPLIGVVNVLNKSPRDVEIMVADQLRDGYLKDPSVSVEVVESRPFYIMGEVRSPGSYSYVNGMNVLQAVAVSGGFTYRANRKSMDILRGNNAPSDPESMKPEESIKPGDIIYVRERFF
jgi:polysaccharide export outer membrane protein